MAGGFGTRLWPASSSRKPKQFLSISGEDSESFFSTAVERALALIEGDDGRVIVISGKSHIPHIIAACSGLSAAEKKRIVLIPEPAAKNTAPAIACALMYTDWVNGRERNMIVLTSDHIIQPLETFKTDAQAAAAFAQQDKLAVFGIRPSKPETGYGYIETAKRLSARLGEGELRHLAEPEVFSVASFREKPDRKKAEEFIASKRFYWNSGMFAFSSKFMIGEFRRLAHDVIRPFEQLRAPDKNSYITRKGLRILNGWADLDEAYHRVKSISFDYAIAEKCSQVVMVSAGFDWIDAGNWEEYARMLGNTKSEVYIAGDAKKADCFVDSDIPVALAGVDNLIVVIRRGKDGSPPVALITKKGETQYVREIVEQIKKAGRTELL